MASLSTFLPDYLWCTKRVKNTDTGRPVFQKYGPTRKNTGRPVNLRVDPYFRYGSTRTSAGRPVNIRVHPYFYRSTRIIRVDPYFCGSTRIFNTYIKIRVDPYFKNAGRPVKYGSTCNLRVDPYYTGRPVFSLKKTDQSEDGFHRLFGTFEISLKSML